MEEFEFFKQFDYPEVPFVKPKETIPHFEGDVQLSQDREAKNERHRLLAAELGWEGHFQSINMILLL